MSSLEDIVGKNLRRWAEDPILFLKETIQVELDEWQTVFLRLVAKHPRVACRSGHGTGKSACTSFLLIWFLFTRYPAKIIVTAPKADQLQDIIWAEVSFWRRKLPPILADNLIIQSDTIYLAGLAKENFAVARTARRETPEGFQGQHSPNQMCIADEASGIPDSIFEVIEGMMTTRGSRLVLIGNPTRLKGYFYHSFHKDRKRWRRMHVSSEQARMVDPEWLQYMKTKYNTESNTYKVRVRGEFPSEDEGTVISRALAEEARYRQVEETDLYPVVWGLDVARKGGNKTALAKRQGDRQLEKVRWWPKQSLTETAACIAEEYQITKIHTPKLIPVAINVDVDGLGAGVYDILYDQGLPVNAISGAHGCIYKDRYFRKRDENWFMCAEWLETNRVSLILDDEDLVDQLTLPKFKTLTQGYKKVESKEELETRNEESPDLADAFILTFASGHDKLYKEIVVPKRPDRWANHGDEEVKGSWLSL